MKKNSIPFICFAVTCLFFILQIQVFSQSVEVSWNDEHQRITGFGASGGNSSAENFMKLPEEDKKKLCDLFFSVEKGIGLTVVRNELYWHIEPFPGVWDWGKDTAQVWLMNEAKKRGATLFWSAVWSMPGWMKDNNKHTDGGHLTTSHYQDYADYLARYVQEYKKRFDLDIYGISVTNEPNIGPNYQSCIWDGPTLRTFIRDFMKPTFIRQGVKAKIIMPEYSIWKFDFADSVLSDSKAVEAVDIVAAHQYWHTDSLLEAYPLAKKLNKELWQTETSGIDGKPDDSMVFGLKYAKEIHNAMVGAEVNSWVWWVFLNSWGDNEGLATMHANKYTISKRLYSLGNWSKFVRPGYIMIGITHTPAPGIFCTAFKNPATGEFAIIMINKNLENVSIPVRFSGFSAKTVVPWITSDTYNLDKQAVVKSNAGKKGFAANLAGNSITTFTGENRTIP